MDRRTFMNSAAASLAALGLPITPALASMPTSERKLIVVFVQGGWDITPSWPMDSTTAGWTWSPTPSGHRGRHRLHRACSPPQCVQLHGGKSRPYLVLNGVMVRSMPTKSATIAMAGDHLRLDAGLAAIAGSSMADTFTLPHLVLGGPNFAGDLGTAVARSGSAGQARAPQWRHPRASRWEASHWSRPRWASLTATSPDVRRPEC